MSCNISNRSLLLAGALIVLGALTVITPWYIFPVCEAKGVSSHSMSSMASGAGSDQSTGMSAGILMKCGYTARAEAAVGALVIVAGLALIALPKRVSQKAVGITGIGLGVVTALIPAILLGVCNAADAPCRIGTLPALILLGILTIVVGILIALIRNDPPTAAN